MDAIISNGAQSFDDSPRRLSDLWQLPLLIVSIALSICAAYLFVDAKPALAFQQKIQSIKQLLQNERPEAAAQSLTRLAASERLPREYEAKVHLLLAESLDAAQKQTHAAPAANYLRVIEESQIALAQGVQPTGEIHRRLGECYEALGKPADAASQYRQAIAIEPARGLRLQRKVIDLQVAANDLAAVEASLDAFLKTASISDAERAWADNQKAQLLMDRGAVVDARRLLEDALRLDADPIAQAATTYRLGICAWKSGRTEEAVPMIASARAAFNGQHPLDAAAAVTLGSIAQEKNDFAKATEMFDAALAAKPDAVTALRAHLARAACRLQKRDDDAAVVDLRDSVELAVQAPAALKAQATASMRQAATMLATRENYAAAVELLGFERTLEPNVNADFYSRLASAYEKRAEQTEKTAADASGAERVRRVQSAREYRCKSAENCLAMSRSLAAAGDKNYAGSLWRAVELLEAAGDRQAVSSALELWVNERADDPITPEALARLGKTYEAMGQADAAVGAYQRLQGAYPQSGAAMQSAVPLARLYTAKDATRVPLAIKVLSGAIAATDADVRRDAMLELARIEARAGLDDHAMGHLEKFATDFAKDAKAIASMGEVNFLVAECSAHRAAKIDVRSLSATAASEGSNDVGQLTQASAAKKAHLQKAAGFYDKASAFYRTTPATREDDRKFQMLASMRRADCAYEMAEYESAVTLYTQAAKEITDAPTVVAANIQIANAYFAMRKPDEAKSATERAKQMLHQLPAGANGQATVPLPAAYWEQWLQWTGRGGTW